jgi:hypothetical protein
VVRAGRASVDCTLEGRLAQARERLRADIVELLEPEDVAAEADAAEPAGGEDDAADAADEEASR